MIDEASVNPPAGIGCLYCYDIDGGCVMCNANKPVRDIALPDGTVRRNVGSDNLSDEDRASMALTDDEQMQALNEPIPQDDEPAEKYLAEDHECEFTIDPDVENPEDNYHYLRRCSKCQHTWYCLHCRCERPDVSSRCTSADCWKGRE